MESNISIVVSIGGRRNRGLLRKYVETPVDIPSRLNVTDVETLGAKLMRLVTNGIARVNFKSRSTTCYLLWDREAVKKALRSIRETR